MSSTDADASTTPDGISNSEVTFPLLRLDVLDLALLQGGRRGSGVGTGAGAGNVAFGRRQETAVRAAPPSGCTPASAARASGQRQVPKVPKLPISTALTKGAASSLLTPRHWMQCKHRHTDCSPVDNMPLVRESSALHGLASLHGRWRAAGCLAVHFAACCKHCRLRSSGCTAGASMRPLSARAEATPPLTARRAQSSRMKGLNEKVEKLLLVRSVLLTLLCTAGSFHHRVSSAWEEPLFDN